MKTLILVIVAFVCGTVSACVYQILSSPAPSGCIYPGAGDPGVASNRPADPQSSGWPSSPGYGWQGRWVVTHDPLVTLTTQTFQWESYWLTPGLVMQPASASGRAIIFRLQGNPLVKITGISPQGVVSANGRSAYGCCDPAGLIKIDVEAPAGAESGGTGALWAIEANGAASYGLEHRFEIRTP
jgi:hypothetical protein